MFYAYDQFGWLTGTTDTLTGRATAEIPPVEDDVRKANFDGLTWRLIDKSMYMQARFPELATPMLVITSCHVDTAHTGYPYLDLNFADGEITIPAGAAIVVNFEVQCYGVKVDQSAHWRVPLQPVDFNNQPNGPTRLIIAAMDKGSGSVTYQSRDGQSEKLILNEAVVNSGLKTGKLLMPSPLSIFIVE